MNFDIIKSLDSELKKKGVIMIVWGWIMCVTYALGYLEQNAVMSFEIRDLFNIISMMLGPVGLLITFIYLYRVRDQSRRKSFIEVTYVWISMLIAMVLVNLILFNVLHEVNFELQHPIFMVIIGFTMSMSGRIINFRPLMIGGLLFGLLGYGASHYHLGEQMVIEAVGWVVGFVIPGHILYSRKGQVNFHA